MMVDDNANEISGEDSGVETAAEAQESQDAGLASPDSEPLADSTPEPVDDTPEIAENQAKPVPEPPKALTLLERQSRRAAQINELLAEKERLQLNYIYKRVPKPYYARWKVEGNELFALNVVLRKRQRQNQKRRAASSG